MFVSSKTIFLYYYWLRKVAMQFNINASGTPTHVLFPSVTMENVPLLKLNFENKILYQHPQVEGKATTVKQFSSPKPIIT